MSPEAVNVHHIMRFYSYAKPKYNEKLFSYGTLPVNTDDILQREQSRRAVAIHL